MAVERKVKERSMKISDRKICRENETESATSGRKRKKN